MAVLLALAILVTAWLLVRDALWPPSPPSSPPSQPARPSEPVRKPAPDIPEPPAPAQPTSETLEEKARRLDWVIVQAMRSEGLTQDRVRLLEVAPVDSARGRYSRHSLAVDVDSPEGFLAALGRSVALLNEASPAPEVALGRVGERSWQLSILGEPTHALLFPPAPAPLPWQTEPKHPIGSFKPGRGGAVALVIDDLGEDFGAARQLVEMDMAITFSVLPFRSHSAQTARLAAEHGRDVLLHLPMEPRDYPRQNPGLGALFARMSASEIAAGVARDLAQVPHVKGVNNHMGSRFTESGPGVAVVLAELRERGLFFLDSATTSSSAVPAEARRLGMSCYRRDVFLDNVQDVSAILKQLRQTESVAAKRGYAVAIGHPHRATIEALRRWEREKSPETRVVPLSSLPR